MKEKWLQQAVKVKTWMQESPIQAATLHIGTFIAALANFEHLGVKVGLVTAAATVASLVTTVGNSPITESYLYLSGEMFQRKRVGKRAILQAHAVLYAMGGTQATTALKKGLLVLRSNYRRNSSRLPPHPMLPVVTYTTPTGVTLTEKLDGTVAAMRDLIVKESIYALVIGKQNDDDNKVPDTTLSPAIQHYVLTQYPEWFALRPHVFTVSTVSALQPNLGSALVCIQGLGYAPEEQVGALKEWLANPGRNAAVPAALPDSLSA